MYKTLIGIVLITFCTFSAVFSTEPVKTEKAKPAFGGKRDGPDKKLHRKCLYPTVKVTNADGDEGGTGFIVRSTKVGDEWHNIVITAAHLVEPCPCCDEDLWVHVPAYEDWSTIKEYKKYRLATYARGKNIDLSVAMFASPEKMPVAQMDLEAKLYMNTEVFHVGCAILDDPRVDFGQVTAPKAMSPPAFKGQIRTNVHTFMGDSGGPLFLKSNYKVIGVAHAIRSFRGFLLPNISFYTPISELKTWDAELNNALESVYNEKANMPVLPFVRLRLKAYTISE